MQPKKAPTARKSQGNDSLPTLYIDVASVRRRNDGMYFISFSVGLPDIITEQARVMIDDGHFRQMISSFCRTADYYPEKPGDKKEALKK